MIGRAAYHHPWLFRNADTLFFGAGRDGGRSRREVVERYLDYAEKMVLLHKVRILPPFLSPPCQSSPNSKDCSKARFSSQPSVPPFLLFPG